MHPSASSATIEALAAQSRASRRRGDKLEQAIFDAVLAELAEGEYARLTFEGVAARARTGKSALYRRWPNKTELVLETMQARSLDWNDFVATGSLRADLIGFVEHVTVGLDGPAGVAMRSLIGEAHHSPEVFDALLVRFLDPRRNALESLLRDAAARGELDAALLTEHVIDVIPALVMTHYLLNRGLTTTEVIESMIDSVLLPLIQPNSASRPTSRVRLRRIDT